MKTISDEYRALNRREHEAADGYGIRGHLHLKHVLHLAERSKSTSVLDYGCGQATLAKHARRVSEIPFACYDPAIPEYAADPEPADLVSCTDVLEHIEPLYLGSVLEHIATLAQRAVYLQIACRPAKRVLSDGRNAHLIVREPHQWFDMIREHFEIIEYKAAPGHSVIIIGRKLGASWT